MISKDKNEKLDRQLKGKKKVNKKKILLENFSGSTEQNVVSL